jgi:DNA-binding beta-propeller fold protein YncE
MTLSNRLAVTVALIGLALTPAIADDFHNQNQSVLAQLPKSPERIVPTVPSNGDGNPYGVAFVPEGFRGDGLLKPGDILVSNFNDSSGVQGTGTTVVSVAPNGTLSTFFQGQPPLGFTTALGVLRAGLVLVGSVPTIDNGATAEQGSLLVIDRFGHLVTTLTNATLLDGPWDLTVNDLGIFAQIFVSNVLNGTVTRINVFVGDGNFHVLGTTQIAHGYSFAPNSAAVVVGPTGLAFNPFDGALYVASTDDNAIFAIPFAAFTNQDTNKGTLVYQDNTHLHGPLGLALAPNGNLITANGDAVFAGGMQNELVEFTPQGKFVAQFQVDPGPAGAAFGLAISGFGDNIRFAAVNDNQNQLDTWNVQL